MKKITFLSMLMALLIVGCTKDNLQVDPKQDQLLEARNGNGKAVTKPFKTTIHVPVEGLAEGTFIGFCDGQFGNFNIIDDKMRRVETTITHLGKIFLVSSEACVRPYLQNDPEVFPPEVYGPFLEVIEDFSIPGLITQEETFIAANGKDRLNIQVAFNSYPDPDNKFKSLFQGSFEITGGTGKFEGATGGGSLTGSSSADFINPTFPFIRVLDGEITY